MEADIGKRRSLLLGLALLFLIAFLSIAGATGAFIPVGRWFHEQATATLPIDDPVYMYRRALTYEEAGNSTYAIAAARRATIIEPGYVPALKFLAAKDLKDHQFADAALQCKGLLDKNPNDSTALLGLASAYDGMGQAAQSEELYRKVTENAVYSEVARDAAQRGLDALKHRENPGLTRGGSAQNP